MKPRHCGGFRKKPFTPWGWSTTHEAPASSQTIRSLGAGASFMPRLRCRAPRLRISREALLAPGVAIDVVAAELPEAGLIAFGELQGVQPLRRFPEIKMRYEKARRAAMVGRNRRVLIGQRDHRLLSGKVLQRHVGAVALEAMGEQVGCWRFADPGVGKEIVDGDSGPVGVELAPLGDAVDVTVKFRARQRVELIPRPRLHRPRTDLQREAPLVMRNARCRT